MVSTPGEKCGQSERQGGGGVSEDLWSLRNYRRASKGAEEKKQDGLSGEYWEVWRLLSLGPMKSREGEGKEGRPKDLLSSSGGGGWSFPSKGPEYSRTTEPAQEGF